VARFRGHRRIDPDLRVRRAAREGGDCDRAAGAGSGALWLRCADGVREVEASLANERLLALQLPLDQRALDGRAEAVRIATIQYTAGRRDLLWVAQLQTVQLATEADLIKLKSAQRANRVRLHQALGGSFDAAPAATTPGTLAHGSE
jgi:hypothetical protein